MNVAALRAELEELERAGCGECRVSVYPAVSEDETLGKYVLDFTGEEYAVTEIDVPGAPTEGFISLVFDLEEADEEGRANSSHDPPELDLRSTIWSPA